MALPPAAVESATTAQVPFLTGAFAAYSTISLLLACAKTANPEISHTAQALLRQAKIKFGFLKAATCMFPSPDAVSIQYRQGADDFRIVLKRRFCDTPRSRGEGTQVLPRWRLNKVVTDYGASNEVAVQTGFLFDFYPVLKVLLEPSIRLGRPNVEPSLFRTGANEVVWEFSDIKCAHMY